MTATPMTNAQLRKRASELAKELGEELPDISRMNNAKLVELVAELEAKLAEAAAAAKPEEGDAAKDDEGRPEAPDADGAKDGEDRPEAPDDGEAATNRATYVVANGRSVLTLRGSRREGETVLEKDFENGADVIARLVRVGALKKR